MYIDRKIIAFLQKIRLFLYQDNKSVYFLINQEIKYNPDLKGIRFCREKTFYHWLALGRKELKTEKFTNKAWLAFNADYLKRSMLVHNRIPLKKTV